jgi:hypothetical protein
LEIEVSLSSSVDSLLVGKSECPANFEKDVEGEGWYNWILLGGDDLVLECVAAGKKISVFFEMVFVPRSDCLFKSC